MSAADIPSERKRMADGSVKPASTTDPSPPPPPTSAPSASSTPSAAAGKPKMKPAFRPAKDDTKPTLRDPISRSDPIVTEQAMLRLPPFPSSFTRF